MKTHGKVEITKIFTNANGEEIEFKAKKLNSVTSMKVCFDLAKITGVAGGSAVDGQKEGSMWSAIAAAVYESFTEEKFSHITDLLMEHVWYKDENDSWKKCDDDFWDESVTYIDVMFWLVKENIVNFILTSSTLKLMIEPLLGKDYQTKIQNVFKEI